MKAVNKVVFNNGLGLVLKSKGETQGEKHETKKKECPESLLKYLPW
jgi:hypothetical protein